MQSNKKSRSDDILFDCIFNWFMTEPREKEGREVGREGGVMAPVNPAQTNQSNQIVASRYVPITGSAQGGLGGGERMFLFPCGQLMN